MIYQRLEKEQGPWRLIIWKALLWKNLHEGTQKQPWDQTQGILASIPGFCIPQSLTQASI
jgi:hypothetical protein